MDVARGPSGNPQLKATTGSLQSSSVTDPVSDAASSLRAAALMTLKSKRRKPNALPGLLGRAPPSEPALQLDYGQEEAPTLVTASSMSTSTTVHPDKGMEIEEGQIREEGEISDTDEPPRPVPPPKSSFEAKRSFSSMDASKSRDTSKPPISFPQTGSQSSVGFDSHPAPTPYVLDSEHVRPGLALNQTQYDAAKDHILDLLGWGVHPEYLLEYGLSREIVYYAFSELNLRLPSNLDTTGLIPYPQMTGFFSADNRTIPRSLQATSSPVSNEFLTTSLSGPIPDHQGPIDPSAQTLSPPTKISPQQPPAGTATPPATISGTNLHDIEQQRRQELLARKAVLASRKLKQAAARNAAGESSAPTPSSSSMATDVEMASVVPTETVDDFLKSINTTQTDGMATPEASKTKTPITPPAEVKPRVQSAEHLGHASTLLLDGSPPKGNSSQDTAIDEKSVHGYRSSSLPLAFRRGLKRPVAADFVDLDQSTRNGYPNGGSHSQPNLMQRRKTAMFASASGMRRCVIDVSDSEDDGDETQLWNDGSMTEGRARASPALLVRYTATPPLMTSGSMASRSASITPAALTEKEQEIKRMKELIKQREERGRLKRLASITVSNASVHNGSSPVSGAATPHEQAKREEVASVLSSVPNDDDLHPVISDQLSALPEPPPSSASVSTPTSTAVTPIDTDLDINVPVVTIVDSEQAPTAVIGQEQAETSTLALEGPRPVDGSVDVVKSSSTQIRDALEAQPRHPLAYYSLFEYYPLLLPSSRSFAPAEEADSLSVPVYGSVPNLRPLMVATAIKSVDPNSRVCIYDLSGGGECRDPECEDVHLGRVVFARMEGAGSEPSDEETAKYLHHMLGLSEECGIGFLQRRLQETKGMYSTLGFEERVDRALWPA